MKETPLDEKTEHEFTNILAKISQDNPDFFENMSREELETLEYLLSEKVRLFYKFWFMEHRES